MSKFTVWILFVVFICYISQPFNVNPLNYVSTTITDDWQFCYGFAVTEYSPSFTDIRNLCGDGPFAFGQISAIDQTLYSTVFRSFRNTSIDLAFNTTAQLGNYTTFMTPTSFGIGNFSISNCSTANASNTSLCWNVVQNGTEYYFAPGGFTNAGMEGFQSTNTYVLRVILTAPCYFKNVNDTCNVPGMGLCAPGICLGNATCDNSTAPAPPFIDPNSCQKLGSCDPYTGNYSTTNKVEGSDCFGGDYCITVYSCDNMGTCAVKNGSSACPLPNNTCLLAPICASGNGSAICSYAPSVNATCKADDNWRCRNNDKCGLLGECIPGSLRIFDFPITGCIKNYTCDPLTGIVSPVPSDVGTVCNPNNPCLQSGVCDGNSTTCFSNTSIPIPISPLSNSSYCYPGTCDPSTGNITYGAANIGLSCGQEHPSEKCSAFSCNLIVNTTIGVCVLSGPTTCPNYECLTASCTDDLIGCEFDPLPLNGTLCGGGNFCDGFGICDMGTCGANVGGNNCSLPAFYTPECGNYICDPYFNTCTPNTTGLVGMPCDGGPCFPIIGSKCNELAQCIGPTIQPNNPGCRVNSTSTGQRLLSIFDRSFYGF